MYLLLIVLAAIAIALADSLKNNFSNSIFSHLDQNFWNPKFSSVFFPEVFGVRFDAYNISVGLAFLVLIIASVLAQIDIFQIRFLPVFVQIVLAAVVFIASYSYFYKDVFTKKSKS